MKKTLILKSFLLVIILLLSTQLTLADELTLELHQGWNVLPITIDPDIKEIETAFDSIMDNIIIVREYQVDGVKVYDPGIPPRYNTLQTIAPGKAYQIKMTDAGELTLTGTPFTETSVSLHKGWNKIPYLGDKSKPIEQIIEPIKDNFIIIREYAEKGVGVYDPNIPPRYNTLQEFNLDTGYQIKIKNGIKLNFLGCESEMEIIDPDTGECVINPEFIEDEIHDELIDEKEYLSFGYIIEFEQDPLIKRFTSLNQLSEQISAKVYSAGTIGEIKYNHELSATSEHGIQLSLEQQKQTMEKNHEKLIFGLSGSQDLITGNVVSGHESLEQNFEVMAEYYNVFNGIALEISEQRAKEIEKLNYVKKVYPNLLNNLSLKESVQLINADQVWKLDLNQEECINTGKECLTGHGVTVGVIDTGIDYTHPDFGSCTREQFLNKECDKVIGGYDFSGNDIAIGWSLEEILEQIVPDEDPMDYYGHGTHCAGIIASNGLLKGIAPDAKLYAYKVFPNAYSSIIIQAMEASVDPNKDGDFSDKVDILSMSLGADCSWWGYGESCGPDDPQSKAVDNLVESGTIVVIAAGNSGNNKEGTVGSPGTARKAITVGASFKQNYENFYWDCEPGTLSRCGTCPRNGKIYCNYWGDSNPKVDDITAFSSAGPVEWDKGVIMKPDVVAPGALICATRFGEDFEKGEHPYYEPCEQGKHILFAGTSMATPVVAGAAALMKQAHPDWTPDEIKYALRNTAVDVNRPINVQGYGRIDILKAVQSEKPPVVILDNLQPPISTKTDIIGTATDNYIIEVGTGKHPTSWTIIGSGEPKEKAVLATLDPSMFETGYHSIRIRTTSDIASQDRIIVFLWNIDDLNLLDGWPVKAEYGLGSLTVANIDNDKEEEILSRSLQYLYAWNHDGSYVDGWPVFMGKPRLRSYSSPAPAVADLDNDGIKEIIIGGYDNNVYVYQPDGKLKQGWPVEVTNFRTNSFSTPVIGDVDNDGYQEIVILSTHQVHVLDYQGNELELGWPGFPRSVSGVVAHISPLLGDLDNDDFLDIIFYTLYYNADSDPVLRMNAINNNGINIDGWPFEKVESKYPNNIYNKINSDPVITDIDNDNHLEVIFNDMKSIHVLDSEGKRKRPWPKSFDSVPSTGIIVSDFDDDNYNDIIFASLSLRVGRESIFAYDYLRIYNKDRIKLDKWPVEIYRGSSPAVMTIRRFTTPVIGDMNNDQNPDILSIVGPELGLNPRLPTSKIYAWNKDAEILPGFPKSISKVYFSPTLSDIDKDGDIDLALISEGKVYILDLESDYNRETMQWPMYRQNTRNTGRVSLAEGCTDTDFGKNYFIRGEIYVDGKYHNEDKCNPADGSLNEWYCEDGIQNVESYSCPHDCKDGACIDWSEPQTITLGYGETYDWNGLDFILEDVYAPQRINLDIYDDWKKIYSIGAFAIGNKHIQYIPSLQKYLLINPVKQTTEHVTFKLTQCEDSSCFDQSCDDYCFESIRHYGADLSIREPDKNMFCSRSKSRFCYNGCSDGVCVGDATGCIEFDITKEFPDGKNYDKKGTIVLEDEMKYDYCVDDDPSANLKEMFCAEDENQESYIDEEYYQCPHGCEDGACAEPFEGETYTFSLEYGKSFEDDKLRFLLTDQYVPEKLGFKLYYDRELLSLGASFELGTNYIIEVQDTDRYIKLNFVDQSPAGATIRLTKCGDMSCLDESCNDYCFGNLRYYDGEYNVYQPAKRALCSKYKSEICSIGCQDGVCLTG